MTELLTESFCERCGTRYTFESAAPRKSRLGKVRTLSKGMKNFVLSDDSSFSEAMAEARSEEELAAVAHQLDAFHQTFNFCLTCRQYTCGDCWNNAEGRCLTCAPIPGMEEPVRAAASPAVEAAPLAADPAPDLAWPDADLSSARLSRALGLDTAEAEATAELAELDEPFDMDAALAAAAALAPAAAVAADRADEAPQAEAAPVAEAETAAPVSPAPPHVEGLAPGQSLEDAIAAYEAEHVAAEPEPVVAPDVEPALAEPLVATASVVAAEPVAAAAEPHAEAVAPAPVADEAPSLDPLAAALAAAAIAAPDERPVDVAPEPVAAEPEPEPVAASPEPEPVATAAEPVVEAAPAPQVDVVAQPVWPSPAPSLDGTANGGAPANPWLTVAPDEAGDQPQWPAAPQWPSAAAGFRESPSSLAGRPLMPREDASAMWAASAAEVLSGAPSQAPVPQAPAAAAPTAQPCVSCGLSLSANARFCRRCGTRQG